MLDYERLDLQMFPAGVRIRAEESFHVLADPRRYPGMALGTLFSKIGSMGDRLKLAKLAMEVGSKPVESLFTREEKTVFDFLVTYGFSIKMIDQFFKPFMTGVCLDPQVRVTDRFMLFVLKMFAQGDVGIPSLGMGEIPRQLAARLGDQAIVLDTSVKALDGTTLMLEGGGKLSARAVVLATHGPESARLTGRPYGQGISREVCFYYSTDQLPIERPFLTLNGTGRGIINSVNFPSKVAPDYAPQGKHLVSAVVPGKTDMVEHDLERVVLEELKEWFGGSVKDWQLLQSYTIDHVLPQPLPPSPNPYTVSHHLGGNVFDCSEFVTMPSIQWALLAGKRGAKSVDETLGG